MCFINGNADFSLVTYSNDPAHTDNTGTGMTAGTHAVSNYLLATVVEGFLYEFCHEVQQDHRNYLLPYRMLSRPSRTILKVNHP